MKRILIAFQFLTIIPLEIKGDVAEEEISQSAAFFPVAGVFQGLLAAGSALILINIFPSEIVSGLVILILTVSNGGFHLDGLADTFDALAVKSSGDGAADKEKRLLVMKDSSSGAIGVVAIVLAILLKFLFINSLFSGHSVLAAGFFLFVMPVFSKWVMVPAMYHGVSARKDGLGRIFLDNVNLNTLFISTVSLILFYLAAALLLQPGSAGIGSIVQLFFVLFALLYIYSYASVKFFLRKFGGLTGDSLGATSEISEILLLMVASVWLQHYI